jgi:hypothetical protein
MARGGTAVRVVTVRTEKYVVEERDDYGADRSVSRYRPAGVRLDNDGIRNWWIAGEGIRYYLDHDGTGWRVTDDVGPDDGHLYRMALVGSQRGTAYAVALPTLVEPINYWLDPVCRYVLELVREPGGRRELVLSEIG